MICTKAAQVRQLAWAFLCQAILFEFKIPLDLPIGKNILYQYQNFFESKLGDYTKLLEASRQKAIERMEEQAKFKGTNAI